MTTCECCGKELTDGDTMHGLRYGTLSFTKFIPAKDSAVTVICGPCGEKVYGLIYGSLDSTLGYPAIFDMYTELIVIMKNGYNLIQAIAKLPAVEQRVIQHMIELCKPTKPIH
jgi:transcription elongation factor Elf1